VCVSVCVSVSGREHISETAFPIFTNFVHVTYVRGSVLLRRRCDTSCTSGFMDDVTFKNSPAILTRNRRRVEAWAESGSTGSARIQRVCLCIADSSTRHQTKTKYRYVAVCSLLDDVKSRDVTSLVTVVSAIGLDRK